LFEIKIITKIARYQVEQRRLNHLQVTYNGIRYSIQIEMVYSSILLHSPSALI
jgi:hypothetical protein